MESIDDVFGPNDKPDKSEDRRETDEDSKPYSFDTGYHAEYDEDGGLICEGPVIETDEDGHPLD